MKKRKFGAILLALVIALSTIPTLTLTAAAEEWTEIPAATEIDADGVNTYGELVYAISQADSTKPETLKITLTGDIDLGGKTLRNAGFGTLPNETVIDGNGYAIKNFEVNSDKGGGLFSVDNAAHITIKNLNIGTADSYIVGSFSAAVSTLDTGVGVLIGACPADGYSFDIENVHLYAMLKNTADYSNAASNSKCVAGGLICSVKLTADSTMKNCSVNGYIYNTNSTKNASGKNILTYTAGFVGSVTTTTKEDKTGYSLSITDSVNYADIKSGRHAAGFVSLINDVNVVCHISNSVNNGDITGVLGAGGLVYYNKATTKITNCVNTGVITMNSGSDTTTNLGSAGLVGGVLGGSVTVEQCANFGEINIVNTAEAKQFAAGLIGFMNVGTITVTNSLSVADIVNTSTSEGAYASYAVGYVKSGATLEKVEGCTFVGTVSGNDNITADNVKDSSEAGATDNITYPITLDTVDLFNKLIKDKGWNCGAYLYLDNSGDSASIKYDTTVPQLIGVQKTAVADGKFDIRFIAVIYEEDLELYKNVGFQVTPKIGDTEGAAQDLNSTVVFTTLNGATKTYTAAELGGKYIMALSITGIPATGTVGVTIAPYATDAASETVVFGTEWVLTYTDGVLTSTSVSAE